MPRKWRRSRKSCNSICWRSFTCFPKIWKRWIRAASARLQRGGRKLHRCRAKDYRIYFEKHPEGVLIHRVLHKNTIRDFLFRSNLPMDEEDEQLGGAKGFWKLIEEAEKKS